MRSVAARSRSARPGRCRTVPAVGSRGPHPKPTAPGGGRSSARWRAVPADAPLPAGELPRGHSIALAHAACDAAAEGAEEHADDGGNNREERRKAPERDGRISPGDLVGCEEPDSVEPSADQSAVGTSPAVAVLEAGQDPADGSDYPHGPV